MASIEELRRRTDLSTFVAHLTRDYGAPADDNLLSILLSCRIEARSVYGMAKLTERCAEVAATQRTICFTETPLEHAWMMCSRIDGREVQLSGHGIAFTNTFVSVVLQGPGRRSRWTPALMCRSAASASKRLMRC